MSARPHAVAPAGASATDAPPAAGTAGIDPAFLSSLAHELRNPLAPLVNALFLLRTKIAGDADATWALDIVDRQVNDLRALLDDTSDIARLLRGRLPRPTDRVAAASVLAGAADAARTVLAARRQTVTVVPDDAFLHVQGDRTRLVRALSALLVHAGRAAGQGEAITLAADASDPRCVTFVVEVSAEPGAGMPAAAPASFDAGIGVALADAVARWHDGTLVQRTDGQGRAVSELRVPRGA